MMMMMMMLMLKILVMLMLMLNEGIYPMGRSGWKSAVLLAGAEHTMLLDSSQKIFTSKFCKKLSASLLESWNQNLGIRILESEFQKLIHNLDCDVENRIALDSDPKWWE